MEEKSLSVAFGDSLKEDSISCISDLAEVGLDAIMEDGIVKDIPIVSTAIAIYKMGDGIIKWHNLKKLWIFIKEINNGIVDEEKRNDYQQRFQSNEKFRNQEIEYLLVLIGRYIDYNKPQMLAKLYLAYLDGVIIWRELTVYAEVIDRLLPPDCSMLVSGVLNYSMVDDIDSDVLLRLVGLGLFVEDKSITVPQARKVINGKVNPRKMSKESQKKNFRRTNFGQKLAEILK